MNKKKIAISVDPSLLAMVDMMIDGSSIRSRSQAIEELISKGLKKQPLTTAVILVHENDQELMISDFKEKPLIVSQIEFLENYGVGRIYVVTKKTPAIKKVSELLEQYGLDIEWVFEKESRGNAQALRLLKDKIFSSFVVINGDTFNHFDFSKMRKMHMQSEAWVTMGLNTSSELSLYGSVVMEGDKIIEFDEKAEKGSHIVNAGIYIMRPIVFSEIDNSSLERQFFPAIAKKGEINGYIIPTKHRHFPEKN